LLAFYTVRSIILRGFVAAIILIFILVVLVILDHTRLVFPPVAV
jgi:hypothetical protein